uniref:cellular communication network factor 6-like isoform X1 n=1 Tax=Doryrhamphus excisus TaxID=161450 RepID=UPI0025AE9EDD|nr:cellular communication network factor 6-like isoform X1 [Doryrhamphus excisus]XP_057946869.1 cellular communication network factor 6-like isoform X1 [Doryrhamphus excisus]XP_057946870.1 cellular communication network factor 6-like isoform X1 [Doryrhamphus excisus]
MLSLRRRLLLFILTQQCLIRVLINGQHPVRGGERTTAERQQFCRWPCKCGETPRCTPGVSSVLDGCGCCKSCAKQIGDVCNERDVCDPHKGMYCDFSADRPRFQIGVCAYFMAVGCDLNGAHYENGEAFRPSPLYKCTCIAGVIGCTPAFFQKPAGLLGPAPLMGNLPGSKSSKKHAQDTMYMSAYRDPHLAWKKNCLIQTTTWSPCSKSCGLGVSVRVSNDNGKCEMTKDTRLCLLRPCKKNVMNNIKVPKGKTCQRQFQAKKGEKLILSGCSSTKRFKPMYCGTCMDKRCCSPNKSRMIKVNFRCPGGATTEWKMQWITSCVCQKTCGYSGDMFSDLRLI